MQYSEYVIRTKRPNLRNTRHNTDIVGWITFYYNTLPTVKSLQRMQVGQGCGVNLKEGSFTSLVMSTTGGMGRAASVFYKRLASLLSEKRGVHYSKTMGWIRCRLSFALLRSSLMCIRGARSSKCHPILAEPIKLQLAEGHCHC